MYVCLRIDLCPYIKCLRAPQVLARKELKLVGYDPITLSQSRPHVTATLLMALRGDHDEELHQTSAWSATCAA